jgi:hypothetical protein
MKRTLMQATHTQPHALTIHTDRYSPLLTMGPRIGITMDFRGEFAAASLKPMLVTPDAMALT